jgi:hypothetical protein
MTSAGRGKISRGAARATRARRARRKDPLVTWSLRLPASVDADVKRRAKIEERSANKMAVRLLTEALAEELQQLKRKRAATETADVDLVDL